mmetsp:Transcript_12145/g.27091  ORF Transcript_12145/g.27091 Transcript_12145/m.27091 type:complete len:205 (-) Transcript_12145:173-787(-)
MGRASHLMFILPIAQRVLDTCESPIAGRVRGNASKKDFPRCLSTSRGRRMPRRARPSSELDRSLPLITSCRKCRRSTSRSEMVTISRLREDRRKSRMDNNTLARSEPESVGMTRYSSRTNSFLSIFELPIISAFMTLECWPRGGGAFGLTGFLNGFVGRVSFLTLARGGCGRAEGAPATTSFCSPSRVFARSVASLCSPAEATG